MLAEHKATISKLIPILIIAVLVSIVFTPSNNIYATEDNSYDTNPDTLYERLISEDELISEDDRIAYEAAMALSDMELPDVEEEALKLMYAFDTLVTRHIYEGKTSPALGPIAFALGRTADPQATPVLTRALGLNIENAYVKGNIVKAIGKIESQPGLTPLGDAIYALINALQDEDGSVIEHAVTALGMMKAWDALEDLLYLLSEAKKESMRMALVEALANFPDERVNLALLGELDRRNQEDQTYTNKVVEALGEVGDSLTVSRLTEYISDLEQLKSAIEASTELSEDVKLKLMLIFELDEAIKIAEKAIRNIEGAGHEE